MSVLVVMHEWHNRTTPDHGIRIELLIVARTWYLSICGRQTPIRLLFGGQSLLVVLCRQGNNMQSAKLEGLELKCILLPVCLGLIFYLGRYNFQSSIYACKTTLSASTLACTRRDVIATRSLVALFNALVEGGTIGLASGDHRNGAA